MDALSDVLARARARGAVVCVLGRDVPWGLEFAGTDPLAVHVLLRGQAGLVRGVSTVPVGPGDLVLVRSGAPYIFGSGISAPREPVLLASARGTHAAEAGTDAVLLCGTYTIDGAAGAGLLESLPAQLVLRAEERSPELSAVVALLGAEAGRTAPGQQTVLDRALDHLLVQALRDASTHGTWAQPGWYRALADPALAAALDAVHGAPEHRWTVEAMAGVASLSRAGFARRFAQTVGETPIAYVTRLRVELAAERLLATGETIDEIAAVTGFASEFAMADAFRRHHGLSPGRWRRERRKGRATDAAVGSVHAPCVPGSAVRS